MNIGVGPVVRIAPNRYDFDTLEATKIIYRIGNAFPKSKYYVPFGSPHGPNVLNALENELHATMKRQLASLYSMSTLLSYEATVDSQTAIMRQKLDSFAATGELVNLPAFFQYYAFDVVGMITVSCPTSRSPSLYKTSLGIVSLMLIPVFVYIAWKFYGHDGG